jgi:hypothetical protein
VPELQVISCSLLAQLPNNVVVPVAVTNCRMRTLPLAPLVVFTHAVTLVTEIDRAVPARTPAVAAATNTVAKSLVGCRTSPSLP